MHGGKKKPQILGGGTGGPGVQGSVVRFRALPRDLGPREAFLKVRNLPWPVLLESTARDSDLGRYSYVVADPRVRLEAVGGRVRVTDQTGEWEESDSPLRVLRRVLQGVLADPHPDLPPFQGGAVGFWSYELGQTLDDIPVAALDDLETPVMRVGMYDWVVAWDHLRNKSWILVRAGQEASAESRISSLLQRLDGDRPEASGPVGPNRAWGAFGMEDSGVRRGGAVSPRKRAATYPIPDLPGVRSTFSKEAYLATVERVRQYVLDGDIFQANLSHRLEVPCPGDPYDLYCRLAEANPAPFAAYLEMPGSSIVSASPELFFKLRDGAVETRPIKGTAPRGKGEEEDLRLAAALRESEKDRAENIMIVDLLRNDLSRVCEAGSVKVPAQCSVETHPSVHHLVSTVTGRLHEGGGAVDLLLASFPGGSITGAPKLRAMEIIAELEPTQRGVYTGSIGYIGWDGAAETSIAIRTITVKDGTVFVQVGGAVVADSDPEKEYRETFDKARGLLEAIVPSDGNQGP